MTILYGLSAFPLTPADEHGTVDVESLGGIIDRLRNAQVDSICVLGSTGIYAYLNRSERRRAIEAAVSRAGSVPVMAGIGALRTSEVLALAADAQEAGAAALLLAPVSYTPLKDDEVFTLFETVSNAVRVPICIYNNPGTTHFTFSTELIERISRLPRVQGIKNPAPDASGVAAHVAALHGRLPADFSVGYSGDWNATEALLAGANAWYSVAAGLFPAACLGIVRAAQAGDAQKARELNARMQPLWDLFKELSSIRVMYAAASALNLISAVPPRPILPLSETDQRRVAETLGALQLSSMHAGLLSLNLTSPVSMPTNPASSKSSLLQATASLF